MRDVQAIPVYAASRRIRDTLERSLELLLKGKNLLVFPENKERPINEVLGDFSTGFLALARLYYQKTRKAICFLPVAVNQRVKGIRIGRPIRFDCPPPLPPGEAAPEAGAGGFGLPPVLRAGAGAGGPAGYFTVRSNTPSQSSPGGERRNSSMRRRNTSLAWSW
jgi:hypothetical protein